MGVYFVIGLFIGIIMVGIYWGMPLANTGPKSPSRVALILATAPFIWPVQLAFYATRYLTRVSHEASYAPKDTSISDTQNSQEQSTIQICVELVRTLRREAGEDPFSNLSVEQAYNSKFIGSFLGIIEFIASSRGEEMEMIVPDVMIILFGSNHEAALETVSAGGDNTVLMDALMNTQERLEACASIDETQDVLQSLSRYLR